MHLDRITREQLPSGLFRLTGHRSDGTTFPVRKTCTRPYTWVAIRKSWYGGAPLPIAGATEPIRITCHCSRPTGKYILAVYAVEPGSQLWWTYLTSDNRVYRDLTGRAVFPWLTQATAAEFARAQGLTSLREFASEAAGKAWVAEHLIIGLVRQ